MISLLGVTPGDGRAGVGWFEAVGRAGLPAVLIREPTLDEGTLDAWVAAATACVPYVVVHGKNPYAEEVATRRGVPLHGPGRAGVSAHDVGTVDAALRAGATYVLLSPVWKPGSKPGDRRPPLGLDRFVAIAAGRPVLALGGVTPERYHELRERGFGAAILGPLAGPIDGLSETLSTFLDR